MTLLLGCYEEKEQIVLMRLIEEKYYEHEI